MEPGIHTALTRVAAFAVACMALLVASAPAAAAPKRISGKLSKTGYTVIALASGGKATSVRVKRHKFRLRPPAKRVTLHLRARDGRYAGPIVVGRKKKGKVAILGVKAGARLGRIKIRRGYAKPVKRLRKRWLDARRSARARKGIPIGARRFGRVRSRHVRGPAPGDADIDGIPDVLDIDDDGDLTLDSLDRSPIGGAAQVPPEIFDVLTGMDLALERTANANATAVTQSQIDAALSSSGRLLLEVLPGSSPELDCGGAKQLPARSQGLVYCSRDGTGRIFQAGVPPFSWPRFPDCCDPDGDGFGTLSGSAPPGGTTPFMSLAHGARTDQINTGDVLVERVTRSGKETQFPTTLQFVFATVPALVSYGDTATPRHSATVDYPVTGPHLNPTPPPTLGDPGTQGNGFPVAPGPDGDVVVTLTFWRPQRRPIPPEKGDWVDIHGLTHYTVVASIAEQRSPQELPQPGLPISKPCPQSAYSTADPNLTPTAPPVNPGFTDLDPPASPVNTFTYTLNLSRCLASLGASWHPGDEASIGFNATLPPPGAAGTGQSVWFRLR